MKTKIINVCVLSPQGKQNQTEIYSVLVNKKTKHLSRYIKSLKQKYINCDILYHAYSPKTRTEYFKAAALLQERELLEIEEEFSKVASSICNRLSKNGKIFCRTEKDGVIIIERIK